MSAREPDGKIDPLALKIENYLKRWDQGDNQRIKDLIADPFTRKLVGSLLGYVVLNTNIIMFTLTKCDTFYKKYKQISRQIHILSNQIPQD